MRLAVKAFDDNREVRFFIVELDPAQVLNIMQIVNSGLLGDSEMIGVTLEAKGSVLVGWHEALEELVEQAEVGYALTSFKGAEAEIFAPSCLMHVSGDGVYWLAWPEDRVTPVDSFTLEREDIEELLKNA